MCVSGYRKRDYRTVTDNKDILHCCMGVDMEGTECSCAKNGIRTRPVARIF